MATGEFVAPLLTGSSENVWTVAISSDGSYIAASSQEYVINVWDTKTYKLSTSPFKGHTDAIMSLATSSGGRYIVSGSRDRTIRIWDTKTGNTIAAPLEGHTQDVMTIAVSQERGLIVSGSNDNIVRIWDAKLDVFPSDPDDRIGSDTDIAPSTNHQYSNDLLDLCHVPNAPNNEGWVSGKDGKLVLWVPAEWRTGFWTTHTVRILGAPAVKVDLSRSAHGTEWAKCYIPGSH